MLRLALALVLLVATTAADVWEPIRRAAAEIDAAVKANDVQALRRYAQHKQVWFFAHELCTRGRYEAALALARAAAGPELAKLPAYVERRRKRESDAALTKTFDAVVRDLRGGNAESVARAVDAVAKIERKGASVLETYLLIFQAKGLRALGRLDEAADVFFAAAVEAHEFGFLGGAMDGYYEAGGTRFRQRDPLGAAECWQRLLAIEETCRPPATVAATCGNIGDAYNKAGEPLEALPYHERALELFRAARSPHTARALTNCAAAYAVAGEYTRALRCLEQAMRLSERGPPELLGRQLNQVAAIHAMLGDHDQALAFYRRARGVFENAGNALEVASLDAQIGSALVASEQYDTAVPYLERARARLEKTDHSDLAFAVGALGRVAIARENYDEALALHREAHAIAKRGPNARLRLSMASALGLALIYAGKIGDAIELIEGTLAEAEERGLFDVVVNCQWGLAAAHLREERWTEAQRWVRAAIGGLGERLRGIGQSQSAEARSRYVLLFHHGAMAARGLGAWKDAAYFMESSRAMALLQSLGGRDRLRARTIPEGLREAERQARRNAALAERRLARAKAAKDFKASRARKKEHDQARNELARVLERIETEAADAAEILHPRVAPLARIQSWLGADEALVSYLLLWGEKALAMVVTKDAARLVVLGGADPIRAACDEVVFDDVEVDPGDEIAALRAMAWTPLALPAGTKRVLVSPSGELSRIPFAALAPDVEIVYVPSATTYGLLRVQAEKREKGAQILALGDPVYEGKLAPLPHTRREAESIGDVVLLGEKATEAGLKQALAKQKRWRAIHLACHGLVDMRRPMLSSLALTGGRLTAYEVLQLDVPADLVVLSACETGKGKVALAEGVLGLTRTFMYAGASRVIVSLWPVEDKATQALMKRFYSTWKKGTPTATALRRAQDHVRHQKQWSHPRYWAAWQLWGLGE